MVKIKNEYLKTVVAFGSNGFCLGKRTYEELIDLALMSYNNNGLQNFFETPLPTADELRNIKMQLAEKKINDAWKNKRQGS